MSDRPAAIAMPDLPSLTGLRFWAAFSIALNHLLLGFVARDNPYFGTMLSACGVLGMNMFFVLSGFIIHYNYHRKMARLDRRSLYEFFVARFSRLYPLFILVFLVELLTPIAAIRASDSVRALPFFLTMTQSWFYHQLPSGASVTYLFPRASITWSISTEMLMYASYPLILLALRRDTLTARGRAMMVVGLAVTASLALRLVNNNLPFVDWVGTRLFGERASLAAAGSYSFAVWFVFLSPYVRVFEFLIGCLAAHLYLTRLGTPVTRREAAWASIAAALALGFILLTFLPARIAPAFIAEAFKLIGYYPSIAVMVFCSARYGIWLTRALSLRPFVQLGEYSYSIYLVHIFIYSAVVHAPSPVGVLLLKLLVTWTALFTCAYILYTYIEIPWRRRVRDLLLRLGPGPRRPDIALPRSQAA